MGSESTQNGCGGYAIWFTWLIVNTFGMGLGWALGWWVSFLVPGIWATWVIGGISGLILGSFQEFVVRRIVKDSLLWIPITTLGWALGFFVGAQISAYWGLAEFAFGGMLGAVLGLILGVTQWYFLRNQAAGSVWWIGASTIGWAASLAVYQPGVNLMGLVYGAVSGSLSGLVLVAIWAGIIKTPFKNTEIQP